MLAEFGFSRMRTKNAVPRAGGTRESRAIGVSVARFASYGAAPVRVSASAALHRIGRT